MENNANYKSGFVALIGRPNVGKSTLMNHLIGQKIAITSKKPQTTRNRIQTVYTCDEGQIVFLDTPGRSAEHGMISANWNSLRYVSMNSRILSFSTVSVLLIMRMTGALTFSRISAI